MDPIKEGPGRTPPPRPARTDELADDLSLVPRPSAEITTSISTGQPARLRKRESNNTNMRTPTPDTNGTISRARGGNGNGASSKARKGSLRDVVRRIFGGGKKVEQERVLEKQPVPSGHAYHTSDPGKLMIPEEQESATTNQAGPQRTLSAPLRYLETSTMNKSRSPYAVEFPKSARLKPLDLGNPFSRPVASQRRSSLPSLVVDDASAATLANAIAAGGDQKSRLADGDVDDAPDIGVAVTSSSDNRRSRSVGDLRQSVLTMQPVRERQDEIRYWRESYTGSVVPNYAQDNVRESVSAVSALGTEVATPSGHQTDPFTFVSPEAPRAPTLGTEMPPVTAGGGISSETEDRVTNLESSLLALQASLQQLTANNNRHTVILEKSSPRQSRQQTPSMLLNSQRVPSYLGTNVMSGSDADVFGEPATTKEGRPFRSRTPSPNPRTFATLYKIINDERSARRVLEARVHELQRNLSELQYQLSQPIITRNSPVYTPQTPPRPHTYSSSRTADRSTGQSYNYMHPRQERVVSHFSQSDSQTDSDVAQIQQSQTPRHLSQQTYQGYRPGRANANATEDDEGLHTGSDEAYQTPTEERQVDAYGHEPDDEDDDGMF